MARGSRAQFQRYTSSDIHWRLVALSPQDPPHPHLYDECCCHQALFCPYYATLEGTLGSDWGVIVNPESTKFGQLVFEHHDCGCPTDEEGHTAHGGGDQATDEWLVPTCRSGRSHKRWGYQSCIREKGHRGKHREHGGIEWRP